MRFCKIILGEDHHIYDQLQGKIKKDVRKAVHTYPKTVLKAEIIINLQVTVSIRNVYIHKIMNL